MSRNQFPVYEDNESLYISSFGLEEDGKEAFWGPGRRSECVLHYVLNGNGYFNGIQVSEGQGFYFGAGDLVEYYPDDRDPWNYFWFNCSEMFARKYILPTLALDANGVFNYGYKHRLMMVINKIFNHNYAMSTVESLGSAFAVLMLHEQPKQTTKTQYTVLQAKRYIDYNLNRKLTVTDVAEELAINDRYLYNLFMKYEGISPKEYILRKKIESAADLLTHTSLSVQEVSTAVGISDIYSFSKLFKARLGVSPSMYRNVTDDKGAVSTDIEYTVDKCGKI